ncbi:MAG: mechanosensitive ion channel family protein [Bacteroidota bacterium]
MQDWFDLLPSSAVIRDFLNSPSTWSQAGIILAGLLLAVFIGGWLQRRLQALAQPGAMEGVGRTAVRTGALGLIPLLLWLWLLAAIEILRRHGGETGLLHPAMILAGAAAVIRMGVFALRHTFNPGGVLKAWEGVLTVTIWTLVALHILGWLPFVEDMLGDYAVYFGQVRISLYTAASFLFSVALFLLAALGIAGALGNRIRRSRVLDDSMKIALSKLIKFVLLVLAVLIAMVTAGIDITALTLFGGALGVGLGFGLQRVVANFVSGFILAFEGSVRPGDVISYGNTYGTVKALHTRHVVIRTRDGLDIIVPNENLLTSDITNWSYEGDRRIRVRLPVQISYSDDPEAALQRLERLALEQEHVLQEPAPIAFLLGFGDNGVNLELLAWVDDPDYSLEVRSALYRKIWNDFRGAGISFPFPQRDVYIKEFQGPAAFPADATTDSRAVSARDRRRAAKAKPPD